jgi:hypothetical protein
VVLERGGIATLPPTTDPLQIVVAPAATEAVVVDVQLRTEAGVLSLEPFTFPPGGGQPLGQPVHPRGFKTEIRFINRGPGRAVVGVERAVIP